MNLNPLFTGGFFVGIIEADESFLGGKPRRRKDDDGNIPPPNKRGRGTKKSKVLGVVERGGNVVARIVTDLSGSRISSFITKHVRIRESELMTDEYKGYTPMSRLMPHHVINHGERRYVDGDIHTNTIEEFWSLLKKAWNGQHHHYSKKYAPLYVAETCFKYNHRKEDIFEVFMSGLFR